MKALGWCGVGWTALVSWMIWLVVVTDNQDVPTWPYGIQIILAGIAFFFLIITTMFFILEEIEKKY